MAPSVGESKFVANPIDAFLLEPLHANGLTYSPPAEPATLLRRVAFDLTGLPPTPRELDAFLADDRPDAYERLLDRLLASPRFGERWGRHWLDVAGYVDTVGFDTDATNVILAEGKWRYRDYVIAAINEDVPFDEFVTAQIAGDEHFDWRRAERLTPEMLRALVATGFLRNARDLTHEDVGVIPQNFYSVLHDTLEMIGTGLLGLTVHCSRCHDHKFDPLPQEDYYRLMACLTPAYNPAAWQPVLPFAANVQDRSLPDVGTADRAEIERHNAAIDVQLRAMRDKLAAARRPCESRLFEEKLARLPAEIREDVRAALAAPGDGRTAVQKYLAEKFAATLKVSMEETNAAFNDTEKPAIKELSDGIAALEASKKRWGKIQALVDVGSPPETHLLERGDEKAPGAPVAPGFLRVLSHSEAESLAAPVAPHAGATGRRTALARWLTAPGTPAAGLLARVTVNRTWQHLFGEGIVPTPENFGVTGAAPTHPALLEWLSAELMQGGWRLKPLIKTMMLSNAYRQASHESRPDSPAAVDPFKVDPDNRWLWRMRLRRLESEAVRDAILAVSGSLRSRMGGEPIPIEARPDGLVAVAVDRLADRDDRFRRSLYLVTRRAYNVSLLTVFDQPAVAVNCTRRDASAVPLQSLVMLNDAFLAEQAEAFANRVAGEASEEDAQIETAFRTALVRRPDESERRICRDLLAKQRATYTAAGQPPDAATRLALVQLCHTLFNASEFLYVE